MVQVVSFQQKNLLPSVVDDSAVVVVGTHEHLPVPSPYSERKGNKNDNARQAEPRSNSDDDSLAMAIPLLSLLGFPPIVCDAIHAADFADKAGILDELDNRNIGFSDVEAVRVDAKGAIRPDAFKPKSSESGNVFNNGIVAVGNSQKKTSKLKRIVI